MRVYVAGPITKGDQFANVADAIRAAEELLRAGHAPYLPHLNYSWHMMFPGTHDQWCALDREWLICCDAVVRLPGESAGSDAEEAFAKEIGLPVFYSVAEFLQEVKLA